MTLPDDDSELIDTLILEGALVIQGVSESGEITYTFTEKLRDMAPELYFGFLEMIHLSIMTLWEKGFVSMDVTLDDPVVTPNEKAFDKNSWKVLTQSEIQTLDALVRASGREV